MSPARPTEPGTQLPGGGLLFGIPGTYSNLLLLIHCSSLPGISALFVSSGTSKHGSGLLVSNQILKSCYSLGREAGSKLLDTRSYLQPIFFEGLYCEKIFFFHLQCHIFCAVGVCCVSLGHFLPISVGPLMLRSW